MRHTYCTNRFGSERLKVTKQWPPIPSPLPSCLFFWYCACKSLIARWLTNGRGGKQVCDVRTGKDQDWHLVPQSVRKLYTVLSMLSPYSLPLPPTHFSWPLTPSWSSPVASASDISPLVYTNDKRVCAENIPERILFCAIVRIQRKVDLTLKKGSCFQRL